MKKILISIAVIGAVAAVVAAGTSAFFSDTETSTNNVFTAGSLDLRFQADGVAAPFTDVNGAPLFDGKLFPMNDSKPGDKGERTVKLWVDDNPACGTVAINVTADSDNDCTTPELNDEQVCGTDGSGELNDNINFLIWEDTGVEASCNNILDKNESPLVSGPLTGAKAYSIGEFPTSETTAKCYGIAYCYGTWNGITCDGSLVNNASQTDSFSADLIINALQKRNQFPDGCPEVGEIQKTS